MNEEELRVRNRELIDLLLKGQRQAVQKLSFGVSRENDAVGACGDTSR